MGKRSFPAKFWFRITNGAEIRRIKAKNLVDAALIAQRRDMWLVCNWRD